MTDRKSTIVFEIECTAPKDMFNDWENISKETKIEIDKNGPIPCEGEGNRDTWCIECRFGKVEVYEE